MFRRCAVPEPAAELQLDRAPTPRELVLEVAERLELALRSDDLLHPGGPERADQLVLEVLDADVRRVAEHAPEPALLAGVAQPDDALALVLRGRAADRLRAADRHDLDARRSEVQPSFAATASSAMRSVMPSTRTTAIARKLA